jgi:DNA repair exonuclease SbcCD ATPase subunit
MGIKPYELFHEAVLVSLRQYRSDYKTASQTFSTLSVVTEADCEQAESLVRQREEKLQQQESVVAISLERLKLVERYQELDAEKSHLIMHHRAVAERLSRAEQIEHQYEWYRALETYLPQIHKLVDLRQQLLECKDQEARVAEAAEQCQEAVTMLSVLCEELRVKQEQHTDKLHELEQQRSQVVERHKRLTRERDRSLRAQELRLQIEEFPIDLVQQLAHARASRDQAQAEWESAKNLVLLAEQRIADYEQRRDELSQVQIGVKCSRCGQNVTAEHAQAERESLERELTRQTSTLLARQDAALRAEREFVLARSSHETLEKSLRDQSMLGNLFAELQRDGPLQDLATLEEDLVSLAEHEHQLSETITQLQRDLKQILSDQKLQDSRRRERQRECEHATQELSAIRAKRAGLEGQIQGQASSLTPEWNERATAKTLTQLNAEFAQLDGPRLSAEYQALKESIQQGRDLQARLDQVESQLHTLPAEARLPLADVQANYETQREASRLLREQILDAKLTAERLKGHYSVWTSEQEKVRALERQVEALAQLESLVGSEGLQRDLVIEAESAIVEYADEILNRLTHGAMSLRLVQRETGKLSKALDLEVEFVDLGYPTGVQFLSGSQKFRVSVALALAIGRYATNSMHKKPIESVIIDEGFGSLDKEGLDTMASELMELSRSAGLKKIILVSHQEQFVSQFPVGYTLSSNPDGTTRAVRFRN